MCLSLRCPKIHSSAWSYLLLQQLRKERFHTAGNSNGWLNSACLGKRVEQNCRASNRKGLRGSGLRDKQCLLLPCPCHCQEEQSPGTRRTAQNLTPGVVYPDGSNGAQAVQPRKRGRSLVRQSESEKFSTLSIPTCIIAGTSYTRKPKKVCDGTCCIVPMDGKR